MWTDFTIYCGSDLRHLFCKTPNGVREMTPKKDIVLLMHYTESTLQWLADTAWWLKQFSQSRISCSCRLEAFEPTKVSLLPQVQDFATRWEVWSIQIWPIQAYVPCRVIREYTSHTKYFRRRLQYIMKRKKNFSPINLVRKWVISEMKKSSWR